MIPDCDTVEGLMFITENHFQQHAKRAHMETSNAEV